VPRRDILLDDDGNRVLVGGDYGFADQAQAVKQGIQCRVRLFLGEYWLNTAKGVDWVNKILIRNAQEAVIKAELSAAIAETPDVTRVVATSFSRDTKERTGSVAFQAASTEGPIEGEA
jgi:hypothetical protein